MAAQITSGSTIEIRSGDIVGSYIVESMCVETRAPIVQEIMDEDGATVAEFYVDPYQRISFEGVCMGGEVTPPDPLKRFSVRELIAEIKRRIGTGDNAKERT